MKCKLRNTIHGFTFPVTLDIDHQSNWPEVKLANTDQMTISAYTFCALNVSKCTRYSTICLLKLVIEYEHKTANFNY